MNLKTQKGCTTKPQNVGVFLSEVFGIELPILKSQNKIPILPFSITYRLCLIQSPSMLFEVVAGNTKSRPLTHKSFTHKRTAQRPL